MNVIECPECKEQVVHCDNDVYLSYPSEPWDGRHVGWTIMHLGPMKIATNGDPGMDGKAHRLHEHQPPEGAMA